MFTKRTNLRHSWQLLMDLDLLDYQTFLEQSASCGPSSAMNFSLMLECVIAWHVWVLCPLSSCQCGGLVTTVRCWRGWVNHRGLCHGGCGGCCLSPGHSLTDSATHSSQLTPHWQLLTLATASGVAPVREIWPHLAANDNIDSTRPDRVYVASVTAMLYWFQFSLKSVSVSQSIVSALSVQ